MYLYKTVVELVPVLYGNVGLLQTLLEMKKWRGQYNPPETLLQCVRMENLLINDNIYACCMMTY
jgi:hypothetical protein